jgi:hypothetical protein
MAEEGLMFLPGASGNVVLDRADEVAPHIDRHLAGRTL